MSSSMYVFTYLDIRVFEVCINLETQHMLNNIYVSNSVVRFILNLLKFEYRVIHSGRWYKFNNFAFNLCVRSHFTLQNFCSDYVTRQCMSHFFTLCHFENDFISFSSPFADSLKTIQIFIKTFRSNMIQTYVVTTTETIKTLKKQISDEEGIPVDETLTGKILGDEFKICDYDIHEGSNLNCRLIYKNESNNWRLLTMSVYFKFGRTLMGEPFITRALFNVYGRKDKW